MQRVLIFDDDPDILALCSIIFRKKGFETKGQTTCRDVISVTTEFDPHVILMDNWIPDDGGIDATHKLKANPATAHIPVIFFSASNDVREYAGQAGADTYLRKPFDITELENSVQKMMESSPRLASHNR